MLQRCVFSKWRHNSCAIKNINLKFRRKYLLIVLLMLDVSGTIGLLQRSSMSECFRWPIKSKKAGLHCSVTEHVFFKSSLYGSTMSVELFMILDRNVSWQLAFSGLDRRQVNGEHDTINTNTQLQSPDPHTHRQNIHLLRHTARWKHLSDQSDTHTTSAESFSKSARQFITHTRPERLISAMSNIITAHTVRY